MRAGVNNGMVDHVVSKLIKKMLQKKINVSGARALFMGITFKENCPDTRNSKVFDVMESLTDYGLEMIGLIRGSTTMEQVKLTSGIGW